MQLKLLGNLFQRYKIESLFLKFRLISYILIISCLGSIFSSCDNVNYIDSATAISIEYKNKDGSFLENPGLAKLKILIKNNTPDTLKWSYSLIHKKGDKPENPYEQSIILQPNEKKIIEQLFYLTEKQYHYLERKKMFNVYAVKGNKQYKIALAEKFQICNSFKQESCKTGNIETSIESVVWH